MWNPAIRWTNKFAVFVVIEDDNGTQGIGECWCFDTAPDALIAFLRTEVIPHFLNMDVANGDSIARQLLLRATLTARHGVLSSALSGIDIALADLQAKLHNLPLSQWLNPSAKSSCFVYSSGGLYGVDKSDADLATELSGMADDGFCLTKMKIGGLSIQQDVARIHAVLEALPDHVNLIVDGVYSYTVEEALAVFDGINTSRIIAFQSPLLASDIAGMVQLKEAGVPVMATEAEYRVEVHKLLVDNNAVSYLQTAPIACGGFQRLKELNELITESGLGSGSGTGTGTGVGTGVGTDKDASTAISLSLEVSSTAVAFLAASHFAAAFDTVAHVEYHYLHQVFFDQFKLNLTQEVVGEFQLPNTAGLGFELPLDRVQHHLTVTV